MSENNRREDERFKEYLRGFRGPAPRAGIAARALRKRSMRRQTIWFSAAVAGLLMMAGLLLTRDSEPGLTAPGRDAHAHTAEQSGGASRGALSAACRNGDIRELDAALENTSRGWQPVLDYPGQAVAAGYLPLDDQNSKEGMVS
jgi:hypothetical protein